jgi:4-alpha-glucanotransferase
MLTRFPRASGILLHPTSLPGRWGIGDLGAAAYRFVDFLADSGQTLWQMLPLNPTGFGDSPYQSPSAFAGNPLLINLEQLHEDGLLDHGDLYDPAGNPVQQFTADYVDYDAVSAFKYPRLRRAFERFRGGAAPAHTAPFDAFCEQNSDWLDDFALFMAISNKHNGASMATWDRQIVTRHEPTIKKLADELAEQVDEQKFWQYLFFSQWTTMKQYANERQIKIVGDAPIFVAYDSADVWANISLFRLDDAGNPTHVAGVPPDFFSATGQRWGNPLYDWDKMAKRGFDWWVRRIKQSLTMVDILRLDHFRGFEAYWEIPAEDDTAVNGQWVPGPGAAIFEKIDEELGELPIIAEDLGVITPEVEKLRDDFNLPGMKVLHFAFGDTATNPYLPHNYSNPNVVVYTGTHDNDTTIGWFDSLADWEREAVQRYLGRDGSDISWSMMREAMASTADMAVVPLQDVLRLGSEARMNVPGLTGNNWAWRFQEEALADPGLAMGLYSLTETYGRTPTEDEQDDAE